MKERMTDIWTDDPEYARLYLDELGILQPVKTRTISVGDSCPIIAEVFGEKPLFHGVVKTPGWTAGFILRRAPHSHFDFLIDQARANRRGSTPVFLISGASEHCHGQRGRPWSAVEGNIHLAVLFRPDRSMPEFGPGFLSLAAVSVIETIDRLPGFHGRAGIKWVNDILVEGAKVAGFLVHTQSTGDHVHSLVLGLGLNVETTPVVDSDPFVPRAAALKHLSSEATGITRSKILPVLIERIYQNYRLMLGGGTAALIDIYRSRSVIIGRHVKVMSDPLDPGEAVQTVASGVVERIGDHLELFIKDRDNPVNRGRLILSE